MDAKIAVITLAVFVPFVALKEAYTQNNSTRSTGVDFLLKFIIINHWNNILVLTDYDAKSLTKTLSALLVKNTILEMKPNASISTLTVIGTALFHGHQYIILWCSTGYEWQNEVMEHLQVIFGKRFTWLLVQNSRKVVLNLKCLGNALGPPSHVYKLSASSENAQQMNYYLAELRHTRFNSSNNIDAIVFNDFNIRLTKRKITNLFPLRGYILKIVAIHAPPVVVIGHNGKRPTPQGFSMVVVKYLSEVLGFTYEPVIDESDAFGGLKNGTWSGVVGTIYRKEADMGVIGHGLTQQRSSAVDFASYILTTNVAAMMRRPPESSQAWNLLLYGEPFSLYIWLVFAGTCVVVFVCMVFTMGDFSFWNRHLPHMPEEYTIVSVVWLFICSVLCRSTNNLPKRLSNQITFLVFVIFVILISKNYESRLTALLTVKKDPSQYNDLDEVVDNGLGVAVLGQSSTYENLKHAKSGTLKKVWNKIQSNPESTVTSNDLGFQKALTEDYVYLRPELDAVVLIKESNCAAIILKQRYLRMTLHFILPKNSTLTELVSLKILQMRSSGVLRKLQEEYIPTYDPDACKFQQLISVPVQQVIGAFAGLCFGVCLAFFFLAVELIHDLILKFLGV